MAPQAPGDQRCETITAMNLPAAIDTPTDLGLTWNHGFAALGADFYTELHPTPLPAPHWVGSSPDVARLLGLDANWQHNDKALQAFSGNALARMEVTDAVGQKTEIVFSGLQRNPAFAAGTFAYSPARGVDVVSGN